MNTTRTTLSIASLALGGLLFGLSADQTQAQCYSRYATYSNYSYAPPVVYAPAPVVYAPAPVYYAPAPVYYAPRAVYRAPRYRSSSFGYASYSSGRHYRGGHHYRSGHHRSYRGYRGHHGSSRRGFSFGFGFSR